MSNDPTNPRSPLYVVSYGRAESCLTPPALDRMDVPYHLVIESEDYEEYAKRFNEDKLLVVPEKYHEEYETYDDLGQEKSQGPGPARNFAWEHSIDAGFDWHWVMDDNIKNFFLYNNNKFAPFRDGSCFRAIEDFVFQYENISMAGPRYFMFISRKTKMPPLTVNTRVYSCNLIRNDVPFRWAGRYNEDTDLSLRMLKNDWCTVLFNMFLQEKIETQRLDGGNTENFYASEGTYPKSAMLKQQHPTVTELLIKWGRWHHEVDYSPFKKNKLKKAANPEISPGEYDFTVSQAGD